jgi:phosphoglycerol transferase MdoB-like AlkP superfamily enzyme
MQPQTARNVVKAIALLGIFQAVLLALVALMLLLGGAVFGAVGDNVVRAVGDAAALVGLLLLALAAVEIWAASELLRHRNWARIFFLVVGVLSLLNFPLGTALGILAIWALGFDRTTIALFKRDRAAVRAAPTP